MENKLFGELKRLYKIGEIKTEVLSNMLQTGQITLAEYIEIIK